MSGHLLALNAGSSSVKFALFERSGDLTLPQVSGRVELAGNSARSGSGTVTHDQALAQIMARVGTARVDGVGHRIVHGGVKYTEPVSIGPGVMDDLARLEALAPLHQPHNLAGVRAAVAVFGGVPQVACFDTAFHTDQPAWNQRFALPQALHDTGVRRYGFHGLSYESVMTQMALHDAGLAQRRVVVAHLGNGASLCAIHRGRSIATTMSFSPLDGLTMGTRCGQLDAAVVLYLMQARGMTAEQITTLLYQQSGLLGLSGVSADMRVLEASGAPSAAQAITHFVEQVVQGVGRMAASMRGIDALVFSGGIGENAVAVRARIMAGSAWLGLRPDGAANEAGGLRISAAGSPISAWIIKTNEESVIARHTSQILLQTGRRAPPVRKG
jgi:acetate kinase